MKLEGEYAVDKGQKAHRISSTIVYAVWIGLSLKTGGVGQAFKTAAFYLLPMACIWFSDAMASYTGVMMGGGRFIEERSHPVFLRWGGWFLLLAVPLVLIAMFALNR
jgi:CDP-diglyceride synthetase